MNKRINVYLMYIIVFLQGFVFYGPIATLYRQNRGLSMNEIFILEAIFMVLMIIFEVPWGYFADRFGYKTTLIVSNLLFLISKIAFYEAHSFSIFLVEGILVALAISGLSGCDSALIYSSIEKEEGEKVFGRYNASATAGLLIASLVSGIIISRSMDYATALTMIPYAIALVLTFFIKDVQLERETQLTIRKSLKSALKNKYIIIFVLAVALIREVSHSIGVFLNQPQYIKVGIDIKYFGLIMTLMQILSLISVKAYKLTEKHGRNKIIGTLFLGISIGCIWLSFVWNPIISIALIGFITGSVALIQPIAMDIQNRSIVTGDRASILSIYAMGGNISAALVNLALGKAADFSLESAFVLCGIVSIIAFIVYMIFGNKLEESCIED